MNRVFFLLIGILALFSCRRTFHKSQPVSIERPSIKVNEIEFEYFQSKAKIDFDDGTNQFSSPMTIRIRKDSVIWISVNPALGIEVVRALITPDSVFVIDKIHKAYYALGLNYVKNNFGVDLTFKMMQSALLGNLILPNSSQDLTEFEGDYAKLRQSRSDMEVLNYIGKTSKKIESAIVTDKKTKNNLTIKYTDIAPLDSFQFGYTTQVIANYLTDKGMMKSNVGINHQRVDLKDKQMRFPFNVKNKYDRK
ncbi:MAG: DUF4292 domain-containing protein [Methylotenera sp.]|nr:DUF4292 domain-containing protein [Flavobacterium sp.]